MKKILKKEYFLLLLIFFVILSTILVKPLGDLDELWNYNVARNIAEGKIPYKDISTITTPLLPFINSIFLKLITNELIVMRILAAILMTAIFYMIFKILKKLTKETNISIIITTLIGLLFREVFCIDYNYMTLFLCLSILYLELNLQNENKSLLIGILAGLAICTKQSIGAVIVVVVVLKPILEISKKEEMKIALKKMANRILGIVIPCVFLLGYLLITNSFQDFIDYAVKGISTFDNKIEYNTLLESQILEVSILAKIMPIAIVITILMSIITKIIEIRKPKLKNETKERFINIQILTLYSLPMIVVIYPIADRIHFLIGITIALICTVYCLVLLGKEVYRKIKYDKKKFHYMTITLMVWVALIATISMQGVVNMFSYIESYKNGKLNQDIAHFKNIEIQDYLKDRIIQINRYIKQKEDEGITVYILDAESAVYTIPLSKYTKDYDMFLKGNIGKDGEQGQIEKIDREANENVIYLVRKDDETLNWQSPLKVIEYVKENFKIVGETEIYDAYMK